MPGLLIAYLMVLALAGFRQEIDPGLKTAVDRFFATQVAEDADAYLALWSKTAKRPEAAQLKYIFDSGDDRFLDLEITRATVTGETARVRGSITRVRTALSATNPDGSPRLFSTRMTFALSYVKEDGEWKLVREGSPVDDLASALVTAPDAESRAALLQAEPELVTSRLLDAMGRHADAFARASQFKDALAIYERGLEVAVFMKDRKGEGQMLQNIANSRYFLRDFPGALTAYERRLALERELANDDGIASALTGIATVRYASFEYSEALKLYREALVIQERLNDEALVATTLISTGNVQYLQGDYDAAIADYRRAEILKRKYHDLSGAAMALEGLGRTYVAQGDYAAAFGAFASLLAEATRRKDLGRQASGYYNIGDAHTRLANLDAARTAYDESRKAYESAKEPANAGRALHGTGIVELMAGRVPQAEAAYEKSHAYCAAAVPKDSECVARALVGLGFAQSSQERWDPAIASYRKGVEAFMQLNAAEATGRARVGLAEALIGKGEFVEAMKEAGEARHVAMGLGVDDLFWRALVSQSRAQRKLKRPEDALGAAKAALGTVRKMAESALRRPGFAISRDVSVAHATVAILQAEAGHAVAAWDVVEEMRALTLRNALASNEREISRGMTDDERATERTLAAELTALHVQRDREKTMAKPDAERLKRLEAAIGPAAEKREAFQQQLFARLPDLSTWRGLAPPATTSDLTPALLDDGQMAVQFVVDDHELLVLTARRNGETIETAAHLVPLKRQALAERVARAMEVIALPDPEPWRKAALEIVKSLPADVFDQITAAKKVLVIPDDLLWRVPFEALPVGAGYLADRSRVFYAPSITSIVRARPQTATAPAFRVAIVVAPEVQPAVVESLKATAPTWTLRNAEAARAQAARIETAAGAEQVVMVAGTAATEDAVRSASAAASALHIEGPFRVNASSPLFSSVLLAAPEASAVPAPASQNGVLEAREIPAAGFTNRVVVFADPAALSMRDSAAALPALQWVWRAGGTEALVVRRWASDDTVSAELMGAFYDALKGGAGAADALEAARSAVRTPSAALPPAAWAGWMVVSAR